MNDMNVTGVVEAVGTDYSGSVKVNGNWHNLKKGTPNNGVKVGDSVTLTLSPWNFKGKTGMSVTAVSITGAACAQKAAVGESNSKPYVARDFDKEARGKTLCQYIAAQLSNPSVDVNDMEAINNRALVLVAYTFGDEVKVTETETAAR